MEGKRCLSIQSHVVHGYVGNKSATFPLQLLGFDVDAINSCQLSSHTGYRTFKGEKLHGDQLLAILQGLEENGLMGAYSHVLTGYVSTPSFLEAIAAAVRTIRGINPRAVFVCDPVMGDHGKLYVPAELVPIYRDVVAPLATLLTPNQFEAEQLTGVCITDEASAIAAMDILHSRGTRAVVITSSALPAGQDDVMLLLASCPWEMVKDDWDSTFAGIAPPLPLPSSTSAKAAEDAASAAAGGAGAGSSPAASPRSHARFAIRIPKLRSVFTGSGDLTAALLLAHADAHPHSLVTACEKTIATVAAVCKRTMAHYAACTAALEAERASAAAAAAADAGAAPASSGDASADAGAAATAAESDAGGATSWLSLAAASTSGQMGSVIPAFNELRIVQSKGDIESAPDSATYRATALDM